MLAMLSSNGCSKTPEKQPEEKQPDPQEQKTDPEEGKQDPNPDRYQRDLVLSSTILDTDVRYSLLLPKDYHDNQDRHYPVVYMLHGYGDDQNSWNGDWLHARDRISALESAGLEDMTCLSRNLSRILTPRSARFLTSSTAASRDTPWEASGPMSLPRNIPRFSSAALLFQCLSARTGSI